MDKEIEAMGAIVKALDELDEETQGRVLAWAKRRYSGAGTVEPEDEGDDNSNGAGGATEKQEYEDFHDLFDSADPQTGAEKALVAGYWFQVNQGEKEFESFRLNKELKNLGHPSTNITRDLDSLIAQKPRLVMQTRKAGTSRQARKKYKLTQAGIKAVEQMME